ncbi:LuxR C-terminal-related transcriptional regulator [Paraburkholderia nemoris]|uniref:LuxR C-terminal-related transcriptional regulator n=1 Tax=Paraburkholderia nemoris TaxID=2793076 RepID=UPI0038BB2A53
MTQPKALLKQGKIKLSEREIAVLRGVVQGKLNKQIASDLRLCERTIKTCRAAVMRKFGADTLAELIMLTAQSEFD